MRRFAGLVVIAAFLTSGVAQAGGRPTIHVWNTSEFVSDAVLADALPVWQRAIDEDFAPAWNADAQLVLDPDGPQEGEWYIEVADNSDAYGALAYHGVMEPAPYARVFVRTAIIEGYNWEVSFTHELWEMLADPYINRSVETGFGRFHRLEVADPVEADTYAYWRPSPSGVPVAISDFVLEAWFRPNVPGPYDFAGHLSDPLQILPGGYIEVWQDGEWVSVDRFRPVREPL